METLQTIDTALARCAVVADTEVKENVKPMEVALRELAPDGRQA